MYKNFPTFFAYTAPQAGVGTIDARTVRCFTTGQGPAIRVVHTTPSPETLRWKKFTVLVTFSILKKINLYP